MAKERASMVEGEGFARSRAEAGLSQDDVARFVGVNRAMVSYWESGKRHPNARQLAALARLYRLDPERLTRGREPNEPDALAEMLYRAESLPASTLPGLRDFTNFLNLYAGLADQLGFEVRGLRQSPFPQSQNFRSKDDARRKAEEVRSWLRLGLGPVPDVDQAAELLGITVFRAGLGEDLRTGVSGGFLNHPGVGFAIVVNMMTTPGRQRFTIAHELAHALFHSRGASVSTSRKNPLERFADTFASEFLMPAEGMRRFMEEYDMDAKIGDPADAVRIQRYFNVSWAMTLVRLRQAKMIDHQTYADFRRVRPVLLARSLGYEPADREYGQDLQAWRIARFPRRFLRLVRMAVAAGEISVPTAASHMSLTIPEVTRIVAQEEFAAEPNEETEREISEYEHVFT